MARSLFKYRPHGGTRRGQVAKLRNVLPRHHMGRVNRAPMTRRIETAQAGQC